MPFVLTLDLALILGNAAASWAGPVALTVFALGLVWYAFALTRGFMIHRNTSLCHAIGQTVVAILLGGACVFGTGALSMLTGPVTVGN